MGDGANAVLGDAGISQRLRRHQIDDKQLLNCQRLGRLLVEWGHP